LPGHQTKSRHHAPFPSHPLAARIASRTKRPTAGDRGSIRISTDTVGAPCAKARAQKRDLCAGGVARQSVAVTHTSCARQASPGRRETAVTPRLVTCPEPPRVSRRRFFACGSPPATPSSAPLAGQCQPRPGARADPASQTTDPDQPRHARSGGQTQPPAGRHGPTTPADTSSVVTWADSSPSAKLTLASERPSNPGRLGA
jgi:hypothetical protein